MSDLYLRYRYQDADGLNVYTLYLASDIKTRAQPLGNVKVMHVDMTTDPAPQTQLANDWEAQ